MAEKKQKRLSKVAKEFNVGIHTIVDFLEKKGMSVDSNPNTKIAAETYELLQQEYSSDLHNKKGSEKLNRIKSRKGNQSISIDDLQDDKEEDDDVYENDDVLLVADSSASNTEKEEPDGNQGDDSQQTSSNKKEEPSGTSETSETSQSSAEETKQPASGETGATGEKGLSEEKPLEKSQEKQEKPQDVPQGKEQEPKGEAAGEQESNEKQEFRVVGKVNLADINEKTRPTSKKSRRKQEKGKEETQQPAANQNTQDKQKKKITDTQQKQKSRAEEQPSREKEEQRGQGQTKDVKSPEATGKEPAGKKESSSPKAKESASAKESHARKKETPAESRPEKGEQQKQPEGPKPEKDAEEAQQQAEETPKTRDDLFRTRTEKLSGPTVVGKINLADSQAKKKEDKPKKDERQRPPRKKRRRIKKDKPAAQQSQDKKQAKGGQQDKNQAKGSQQDKNQGKGGQQDKKQEQKTERKDQHKKVARDDKRKVTPKRRSKRPVRKEVDEEDVQKQVKETLARLEARKKKTNKRTKRIKREQIQKRKEEEEKRQEEESKVLKVTEFISVNEFAQMLDAHPNHIIAKCMELGMVVNINQRLDADTISVIAEEYNYETEFVGIDEEEDVEEEEEVEEGEELSRTPIVTVMGHVDHGKTSLLDYIREANVIAGEAGGITQHIGAYHVSMKGDKSITFIDTPGHQAFTSMRARGAQVTDIAIIVVAADDDIMPQTKEAINHAEAAGVPIVFAINKIDKPNASAHKIKEKLANMNYLVEEWGGKYLSADISAKEGNNVDQLMELVHLQAELQELTAVEDRNAAGTVIEASLDKGRGYAATVLNQAGILKVGDYVLAGSYSGRIKAMFNERGKPIDKVSPSYPAEILGLDGSPQPGDKFKVMENEKEAREIANKRQQLQREQTFRTQRPMTLDEIGRRIAIGNFQEVNVIIKGDFDGSIEALSDSLMKLSTQEVQVKIIHKGVGEISESDVMLAAASKAVIVGFNVRPSMGARKMADQQGIEIRIYSIIYDAINDMKDALEGMLDPEIKEEIEGTAEVRNTFKITKVGTIAGCMVKEGKINRNSNVRVIRDGIVTYTGTLGSLKRYKEDAKEVVSGYECGLNIERFNDIKVGDVVEAYKEKEVKRSLEDTR